MAAPIGGAPSTLCGPTFEEEEDTNPRSGAIIEELEAVAKRAVNWREVDALIETIKKGPDKLRGLRPTQQNILVVIKLLNEEPAYFFYLNNEFIDQEAVSRVFLERAKNRKDLLLKAIALGSDSFLEIISAQFPNEKREAIATAVAFVSVDLNNFFLLNKGFKDLKEIYFPFLQEIEKQGKQELLVRVAAEGGIHLFNEVTISNENLVEETFDWVINYVEQNPSYFFSLNTVFSQKSDVQTIFIRGVLGGEDEEGLIRRGLKQVPAMIGHELLKGSDNYHMYAIEAVSADSLTAYPLLTDDKQEDLSIGLLACKNNIEIFPHLSKNSRSRLKTIDYVLEKDPSMIAHIALEDESQVVGLVHKFPHAASFLPEDFQELGKTYIIERSGFKSSHENYRDILTVLQCINEIVFTVEEADRVANLPKKSPKCTVTFFDGQSPADASGSPKAQTKHTRLSLSTTDAAAGFDPVNSEVAHNGDHQKYSNEPFGVTSSSSGFDGSKRTLPDAAAPSGRRNSLVLQMAQQYEQSISPQKALSTRVLSTTTSVVNLQPVADDAIEYLYRERSDDIDPDGKEASLVLSTFEKERDEIMHGNVNVHQTSLTSTPIVEEAPTNDVVSPRELSEASNFENALSGVERVALMAVRKDYDYGVLCNAVKQNPNIYYLLEKSVAEDPRVQAAFNSKVKASTSSQAGSSRSPSISALSTPPEHTPTQLSARSTDGSNSAYEATNYRKDKTSTSSQAGSSGSTSLSHDSTTPEHTPTQLSPRDSISESDFDDSKENHPTANGKSSQNVTIGSNRGRGRGGRRARLNRVSSLEPQPIRGGTRAKSGVTRSHTINGSMSSSTSASQEKPANSVPKNKFRNVASRVIERRNTSTPTDTSSNRNSSPNPSTVKKKFQRLVRQAGKKSSEASIARRRAAAAEAASAVGSNEPVSIRNGRPLPKDEDSEPKPKTKKTSNIEKPRWQ